MHSRFGPLLLPLFLVAAAPALAGGSSNCADRTPRVAGEVEQAPAATPKRPMSSQDLLPPPASRPGQPVGQADRTPYVLPSRPEPVALTGSPDGSEDLQPAAATERVPGQVPNSEEMLALAEVNRHRGMNRLPGLRYEPRLYTAAKLHSEEQLRHGYLGHDSPDPARAKLSQRMSQEGYSGRLYAEVVAMNYFDVATVVDAWMKSPSHRAVLLDPELSEGAFCRLDSSDRQTNRWTGDFGAPVQPKTLLPATGALPSGAMRASVPATQAPRSQMPTAATYPAPQPTSGNQDLVNKVPAPAWNSAAPIAARPPAPAQPYGSTSGAPSAGYVAPPPAPAPTYTQPAPAPYRPPVVIRRAPRRVGDCAT